MITSVLFDADGVLQTPSDAWRLSLESLAPSADKTEALLADIFEVEKRCLTGELHFADVLPEVLERWGINRSPLDVLDIWTLIDPRHEILGLVEQVRLLNVHVGLATNQQQHRAAYLVEVLGYDQLFDDLFISCHVGHAKPSESYFKHIAADLNRDPAELLFIDDHPQNVDAARQVGLNAEVYSLDSGVAGMTSILAKHGVSIDA